MVHMLDRDLLDRLERRWREGSPEIFERLAPGLSDAEIRDAVGPVGFSLPEEAVRWFRWQNGSEPYPVIVARTFRSLEMSITAIEDWRSIDDDVPETWLNVMDNRPDIFFDCGGEPSAPVPVWFYDFDRGFPRRPKFQSIGEMVMQWIELIDAGHLVWRADRGGWWDLPDDAPDELLELTSNAPRD